MCSLLLWMLMVHGFSASLSMIVTFEMDFMKAGKVLTCIDHTFYMDYLN